LKKNEQCNKIKSNYHSRAYCTVSSVENSSILFLYYEKLKYIILFFFFFFFFFFYA